VTSVEPDDVVGESRRLQPVPLGRERSVIDVVVAIADDDRQPNAAQPVSG